MADGSLEGELLAFLNAARTPDELVERLGGLEPATFDVGVAQQLLEFRNGLPSQRFGATSEVEASPALSADAFAAMFASFPPLPEWRPTDRPVLLFPVRLETWFTEPEAQVDRELWVRVYPDDVFVNTHDPRLTQTELNEGIEYLKEVNSVPAGADADADVDAVNFETNRRDAWRELARTLGPERAAWVSKLLAEYDDPAQIPLRGEGQAGSIASPELVGLPDHFELFAHRGERVVHVVGKPIHGKYTLMTEKPSNEGLLFDAQSRWVTDFADAEARGLGLRITLADDEDLALGYERLIAVGVRSAAPEANHACLEALFEGHRYGQGMAFLEYGTPTNNTETTESGYSESTEDAEGSYDVEIVGIDIAPNDQRPRTNAQRLERALGGRLEMVAQHVARAGHQGDALAEEMQAALWPVTGDYLLRYLLPKLIPLDGRRRLASHFSRYVRAGGPLPAVRIGDQPYGILPVSGVRQWQASAHDNDGADGGALGFDQRLSQILWKLFDRWLKWANDPERVPRVNTVGGAANGSESGPDAELLKVLAMQPTALGYRTRPFVDEQFVGWLLTVLRQAAFGDVVTYKENGQLVLPSRYQNRDDQDERSEGYLITKWKEAWDGHRAEQSTDWASLTGDLAQTTQGHFKDSYLLKLLGWWNDRELETELVRFTGNGESDEVPSGYLEELCDSRAGAGQAADQAKTLLNEMLRRALKLSDPEQDHGDDETEPPGPPAVERAQVQQAICSLRDYVVAGQSAGSGPTPADAVAEPLEERVQALERGFRHALDLLTHRLDAWMTSLATKRLMSMRASAPSGICLGAYGWVEDLEPSKSSARSDGYTFAPSQAQAQAAAVLHNAYLTHDSSESGTSPYRINLSSLRVRRALRVLEGVRQGQPVGALLGYQFERGLHERRLDHFIDDFRAEFPLVANKGADAGDPGTTEAVAARNVVDGLALARWFEARKRADISSDRGLQHESLFEEIHTNSGLEAEVNGVANSLDAVSDLLTYEGVYQATQGNMERASAALDVLSAGSHPAEIESTRIEVSGRTLGHRVAWLFPASPDTVEGPRASAEPRLAAWFNGVVGDPAEISAGFRFATGRLDINEASRAAIAELPGVPDDTAHKIVHHRRRHGRFKTLEEIKEIWHRLTPQRKGIYRWIARWACTGIDPDEEQAYERINLNEASDHELAQLPGIDLAEARRIVSHRPYVRLDELRKGPGRGPGIGPRTVDRIRPWVSTGVVTLNQVGLGPMDLLYLASAPPASLDKLDIGKEETLDDPLLYASRRINLNEAPVSELAALPGIRLGAAKLVVHYIRHRGPIESFDELTDSRALGDSRWAFERRMLRRWTRVSDALDEDQFYRRININLDTEDEMGLLPGITQPLAKRIAAKRPFATVDELEAIRGLNARKVDRLRPWATAATGMRTAMAVQPGRVRGEDSELEQRLKYFVRSEYGLTVDVPIDTNVWASNHTTYSLGQAIELSRETFVALGRGSLLRPDAFDLASSEDLSAYDETDVAQLQGRIEGALTNMCGLVVTLEGEPLTGLDGEPLCPAEAEEPPNTDHHRRWVHSWGWGPHPTWPPWPPPPPNPEKEEARLRARQLAALFEASRYGIAQIIPAGPGDPEIEELQARARDELERRAEACKRLLAGAAATEPEAGIATSEAGITTLMDALKALFGPSFVVLPTFSSKGHEQLETAFAQRQFKQGEQQYRIQLWLQQAAKAHPPLAELEDVSIAANLWRQTTGSASEPAISFHVAQLPLSDREGWLGLDDDERAELELEPLDPPDDSDEGVLGGGDADAPSDAGGGAGADSEEPEDPDAVAGREVLSIVGAVAGPYPVSQGDSPTRFAGLLMDQWEELLPDETIDTGVGFHYDAPNQQAPQAWLLAVPSTRSEQPQAWMPSALAEIIRDTADLARTRAVDSDAMADIDSDGDETPGVGLVFPALMFPLNPDQPGWVWDEVTGNINSWAEVLEDEDVICTLGTLRFPEDGGPPTLEGTDAKNKPQDWLVSEGEDPAKYSLAKYAPGLLSPGLDGAQLQVKGKGTTVTNRLSVYEYTVAEYPDEPIFERVDGVEGRLGTDNAGQLTLNVDGTVYLLQGSAVLEGHNLQPRGTQMAVTGRKLAADSGHDLLWIDTFEIVNIGGAGPPTLRGIVLRDAVEGLYLWAAEGEKWFLDGLDDEALMAGLIDDRVWVQGTLGNREVEPPEDEKPPSEEPEGDALSDGEPEGDEPIGEPGGKADGGTPPAGDPIAESDGPPDDEQPAAASEGDAVAGQGDQPGTGDSDADGAGDSDEDEPEEVGPPNIVVTAFGLLRPKQAILACEEPPTVQ